MGKTIDGLDLKELSDLKRAALAALGGAPFDGGWTKVRRAKIRRTLMEHGIRQ